MAARPRMEQPPTVLNVTLLDQPGLVRGTSFDTRFMEKIMNCHSGTKNSSSTPSNKATSLASQKRQVSIGVCIILDSGSFPTDITHFDWLRYSFSFFFVEPRDTEDIGWLK